jgi:L-ornithine Nalpha-acyltransferase
VLALSKGRYRVRPAESAGDLARAQELRHRAFVTARGVPQRGEARDADGFDPLCVHVLVEDEAADRLAGCFRILPLSSGADIARTYAAQHYDLSALGSYPGRMVEVGRFCLDPGRREPDVLRLAWGALTAYVDAERIGMLFGCSSFAGTEPDDFLEAFALLAERHLAPAHWRPGVKAPEVFAYARMLDRRKADPRLALQSMPPLLRSYLALGGWVSDHAVVDRALGTMHVFTAVEVGNIPPARARLLRAAVEA